MAGENNMQKVKIICQVPQGETFKCLILRLGNRGFKFYNQLFRNIFKGNEHQQIT